MLPFENLWHPWHLLADKWCQRLTVLLGLAPSEKHWGALWGSWICYLLEESAFVWRWKIAFYPSHKIWQVTRPYPLLENFYCCNCTVVVKMVIQTQLQCCYYQCRSANIFNSFHIRTVLVEILLKLELSPVRPHWSKKKTTHKQNQTNNKGGGTGKHQTSWNSYTGNTL